MTVLILGLAIFFALHTLPILRDVRTRLIAQWGESTYRMAYAVTALVAVALMAWGFSAYRAQGYIPLWTPPRGMSHLTIALMLPASIMFFAEFFRGEIKRRLKYPLAAAIKIWAFSHLLANGDLGSVLIFGAFLIWAVIYRISLKHRPLPETPAGFSQKDVVAIVCGVGVWALMLFRLHELLIGVPVLV